MKLKQILTLAGLLAATNTSYASWLWTDAQGLVTSGTSGSFTLTPDTADYDLTNAVDGRGFDVTPTTLDLFYSSVGGVNDTVSFTLNGAFLDVDLDADGDGVLVSSFTFTTEFNQLVTDRGLVGGGTGVSINTLGAGGIQTDVAIQTFDQNGDAFDVSDANFTFSGQAGTGVGGAGIPDFTGTTYGFDDLSSNSPFTFAGIRNQGLTTTTLPFGGEDGITSQTLTLTDIQTNGGTSFRLSFDGGVVPEPSSTLLSGLGLLAFVFRRQRV